MSGGGKHKDIDVYEDIDGVREPWRIVRCVHGGTHGGTHKGDRAMEDCEVHTEVLQYHRDERAVEFLLLLSIIVRATFLWFRAAVTVVAFAILHIPTSLLHWLQCIANIDTAHFNMR